MRMFRRFVGVLSCVLVALGAGPTLAQPTPQALGAPPTIESFYKPEQFDGAAISPDHTHLAFLREVKGRMNLIVMNLSSREMKNVAGFDNADVVEFRWLSAERLMYYVMDRQAGIGDSNKKGIFAISRDGGAPYTLSEGLISYGGLAGANRGMPARADFYQRARSGNPEDFIAIEFATAPWRAILTRVDSRTGRRTSVDTGGLGSAVAWALDANDVPRAAMTQDGERGAFHVRDSASAPWRKVAEFSLFESGVFEPLRFDKAGTLYVQGRIGGRDHAAIHRFDWAKGAPEPEPLVSVRGYDIESGLLFDTDTDRLVGVRYEAEMRSTQWLDAAWKARQEMVDRALPGKVNLLSGKVDNYIVAVSYSDTSPPRYYLLDAKLNRLSLLGTSRPWVDEKLQSRSDFIRYDARDGLSIPALLTLPRGKEPKALPLIVLVHGGPFVRGVSWGWYDDRQFLASRGYAVLEPEFRGSEGYGWRHARAGWKQFGLAMQDDLVDGVEALAKRGIIDRQRVCIAGASYGGYATVFGLIKHPETYKCGISWVGVTDIDMLYTVGWSDMANFAESRLYLQKTFGDPDADKAQLEATSAVAQASRLKAPLILAYGLEDVRVPYDHGRKLMSRLKAHNDKVDYIEYGGEGHGWHMLQTNLDFWGRVERFLAEHIGK
jgi:dipeptidyl aminopeptidase/acylaminoacyl peptidase